MKWWEIRKHIFVREHVELDKKWPKNDFEFSERQGVLWLIGTLHLPTQYGSKIEFEFELRYPKNYPFSVPYVYPKGREKNWVGNHQFISSGFCLDVRNKTWRSTMSSVDILSSLYSLLMAALHMIENKTGTLDIYEEKEPTKLDKVIKNVNLIISLPHISNNDVFNSGQIKCHKSMGDKRYIICPEVLETQNLNDEKKFQKILSDPLFKIWGLSLLNNSVAIWCRTSLNNLESIVFKETKNDFCSLLKQLDLLKEEEFEVINRDKDTSVVFFVDDKAVLHSRVDHSKNKVSHFGCHNIDFSQLFSRIPVGSNHEYRDKLVTIIGCGAGGSQIAEELVKAGIKKMVLIDPDLLSIENIVRHTCDAKDLGLMKVDALKKKLIRINPEIDIEVLYDTIDIIPAEVDDKIRGSALLINATADIEEIINEYCWKQNIPALYPKVYPTGFGGEIIRIIPKETTCYECFSLRLAYLLEQQKGHENFPKEGFINYSETEEGKILSQPSINTDIRFISLLASKMALELLNNNSVTDSNLRYNAILWSNQKKWIFSDSFECLKVDTSEFQSYNNCIVCHSEEAIEKILNMTSDEILIKANSLNINSSEN